MGGHGKVQGVGGAEQLSTGGEIRPMRWGVGGGWRVLKMQWSRAGLARGGRDQCGSRGYV
eukprot:316389-Hanusia_phi.AAC.2